MGARDCGSVGILMGNLYRRPGSRYWWARWTDADGATHRASTKTCDRRVAQVWLAVRETQAIKEAAGLVPRSVTLADAVGEYLDAHPPPIWSERWCRTVAYWFRGRIIPELGGPDVPVASVDARCMGHARTRWLALGLAPPTVNRIGSIASGFFRWAVREGYAQTNPCAGAKRFAEVRRQPPTLTEADLGRFLEGLHNPVIRRAATVALDTGLRLSEVRRIHPADVRGRELHVASSYARGLTKNRRERWVLLTERARAAIGPGFADLPVNVRKSVATALRLAGLPHIRWHDLRHYALTRAANAGTRPHDLRGMAGWSGDESGRYIHPEAEGMRAFVEQVDRDCAQNVREPCPQAVTGDTAEPPTGDDPGTLH